MKITHIIAGNLQGGAARSVVTLHNQLLKFGVCSRILTNSKLSASDLSNDQIYTINQNIIDRIIIKVTTTIARFYRLRNKSKYFFSTGKIGSLNILNHPLIKDANIVHLHYINEFLSVKDVYNIKSPLVWTIRDMWPFTGGCHYAYECINYTSICGHCPQLNSQTKNDISFKGHITKGMLQSKNISYVSIIHGLQSQLKNHRYFNHKRFLIYQMLLISLVFMHSIKCLPDINLDCHSTRIFCCLVVRI